MSDSLTRFLQREPPTILHSLFLAALTWVAFAAWYAFVPHILGTADGRYGGFSGGIRYRDTVSIETLVLKAAVEEIVFRILALMLIIKRRDGIGTMLLMIVSMSLLFGIMHPFFNPVHDSEAYMLRQFGFGVLLSFLVLKTGGMNDRWLIPAMLATSVHVFQNMVGTSILAVVR